jgi:hypothetical protein
MLAVVAALALAALGAGCAVQSERVTQVSASAATLEANVACVSNARGVVWWEVRKAGAAAWRAAGQREPFACPRSARVRTLELSERVAGLRAGTRYQYRVAGDPAPAGGHVLYSTAQAFTTRRFSPGLVASADHAASAAAARAVGADVVRVEFDVGASPEAMRASVDAIADHGARPLLLAGFHGRMPSEAEARNLGRWAAEFGPGGRFWAGRSDGALAVQQIEFGNETSYGYQYGDGWADASYRERARLYAIRLAQARQAITATGREVGLLAQADDGGSGSSNWVDSMFDAVPNLGSMVDGWTVHPYGPRSRWQPKLDRLIASTAANGAPASIPIDVTEYGISSANGAALGDNYGWPANLTYAQAASALASTVAALRGDARVGPRLRHFMLYAGHDLRAVGATREREHYFGVLQSNLSAKGAYTSEVRKLFSG